MPWASNKPSRNWCCHQLPDQLIKNLMSNGNGRTLLLTVLLVFQAKVPTGPVGAWELSHQLLISLLLHIFNNIATHLDSWALLSWSPPVLCIISKHVIVGPICGLTVISTSRTSPITHLENHYVTFNCTRYILSWTWRRGFQITKKKK